MLLTLFDNNHFTLISPEELKLEPHYIEKIKSRAHIVTESTELQAGIQDADIIYVTRTQEERFASSEEASRYKGLFRLNQAIYTEFCKPNTVIMHPLPRDSRADANELDSDLDSNPNLAIFRQTDNGVLVRMALFALVLDVAHLVDDYACDVRWYNSRQS